MKVRVGARVSEILISSGIFVHRASLKARGNWVVVEFWRKPQPKRTAVTRFDGYLYSEKRGKKGEKERGRGRHNHGRSGERHKPGYLATAR